MKKNFFKVFLFFLWLKLSKKVECKKKYYFSVCAIFKDEGKNLKEWLEFHKLIGTEHFYLYNNFSKDNYEEVLNPYIKEGLITLVDWPYKGGQADAYKHCFLNYRNENNWIAFIDIDEYICPIYEIDIKSWLQKYEKFPMIFINWLMFGSSGNKKISGLIIEECTQCFSSFNYSGKSIVNTFFDRVFDGNVHYNPFIINFLGIKLKCKFAINEKKKIFTDLKDIDYSIFSPTIQLNHYVIKSFEDYAFKIQRGLADVDETKHPEIKRKWDYFWYTDARCISKDFRILRFVSRLKKVLQDD